MSSDVFERLAALGSGPIALGEQGTNADLPHDLTPLAAACDGFYAFESALHVFPSRPTPAEHSVAQWNASDLWRHEYPNVDAGHYFFAEDVFGGQFALSDDGVSTFDPETGLLERIADNLTGWARAVLDDYPYMTGFPLAHEWQLSNGALRVGRRLMPKVPFVLGGAFEVENLYDADSVSALRNRAKLASQIHGLPDGSSITLRVVE